MSVRGKRTSAKRPGAEISGDKITIHNFRSCDYRAEFEYECKWLTKTVDLGQLRGIDVAITDWAHPTSRIQS